jgi:hypothetical protein
MPFPAPQRRLCGCPGDGVLVHEFVIYLLLFGRQLLLLKRPE